MKIPKESPRLIMLAYLTGVNAVILVFPIIALILAAIILAWSYASKIVLS